RSTAHSAPTTTSASVVCPPRPRRFSPSPSSLTPQGGSVFTPALESPTVDNLVVAIRDDEIGGAADMARETARALRTLALDETVADADFAGRLDAAIRAIVEVTPSIMPVTRVLHAAAAAA